jgi:HEAT repeat protein
MMVRTCVAAGTYASLVSLLSIGGFWGLPLAAAPFASVEAPGAPGEEFRRPAAGGGRRAAVDRQEADGSTLPVRAARIERRDASRGVESAVAAIAASDRGTAWLAWTVPAVKGHGEDTDWPNSDRWQDCACVLDEDGHFDHGSGTNGNTTRLVVLTRVHDGTGDRLIFTDARCTVQAANRTVYWLEGVRPADNVRWAVRFVETGAGHDRSDRHDDVRSTALALVALTDDVSADRVLEDFTASQRPLEVRRDAAFWLGAARGAHGAALVDQLARTDRDPRFREHLMFVLTLIGDRGIERLLDRARNDESPQVRGQALFWTAQKAGERAVGTLARAVETDPDVEVRKQAVFAISQLPKDEGVPKLIALAESHRDREVRQQAMFWLGQSGDPRALTFFEQVLRR